MADIKLFIYSVILITIGVVMSYSLSTYPTILYHYDSMHFFTREFGTALLGIALMWGISYLNMDKVFIKFGFILFSSSLILVLIFPLLPESIAPTISGAKRWLKLPFIPISIAPAEFFKVGFVFFLAWSLSRKFNDEEKPLLKEIILLIPYAFIFIVILFFIAFLQNDLGQTVLIGLVMLGLVLVSGGSIRLIFFCFVMVGIGAALAILPRPHRLERLRAWWAGAQDPILAFLPNNWANFLRTENLPEPYQIHNATNAILNGHFMGQGIGDGVVKLGFLSDVHTDMVLAGITEETGFFGLFLCFFFFFVVLLRIFKIANRLDQKPHCLFCIGAGLLIGISLLINALGIASIIPLKGIAVPFLSYGGSSLLANCILLGIVLALSKKAKTLN